MLGHNSTLAISLLLLAGCGDDGSSGGSGDGGADTGGAAGAMCDNEADRAALMRTYDPDMREVPEVARDCAINVCLSEPEATQEACMNTCLTDMTDLSLMCASCVTQSLGCVREHCLTRCLSDPDSADCLACQCGDNTMGVNCRAVYEDCSGVPNDDCAGM